MISFLNSKGIYDESIVLCGGFGRDEGAWIIDCDNFLPYNDFDFTIVSNASISRNEIERLRKEIANTIGIRWIDIDIYSYKHFRFLLPTIKNYDFLYASKLLYGEKKWGRKEIKAKYIGSADICKLLMTRIWTFVGAFSGGFRDLNGEESAFFSYQMAKAVLASVDMYLVYKKAYTSSYIEKVKKFKELFDDENYYMICDWAVNFKMFPRKEIITKEHMINLYETTYYMFWKIVKCVIPRFEIIATNKYYASFYVFTNSRLLLHIFNERLKKNGTHYMDSVDVFFAQLYVVLAYECKDQRKLYYLGKAADILKKLGKPVRDESDWVELKDVVANTRNEV